LNIFFRTNTANTNQVSSYIEADCGSGVNNGDLAIGAGNLFLSGSSNITMDGLTTNINSTFCNVLGNVIVYNQANGWRMWENSNGGSFIQYSASGNILTDGIPWNAMITTRYCFATAITLTLQSR